MAVQSEPKVVYRRSRPNFTALVVEEDDGTFTAKLQYANGSSYLSPGWHDRSVAREVVQGMADREKSK